MFVSRYVLKFQINKLVKNHQIIFNTFYFISFLRKNKQISSEELAEFVHQKFDRREKR